LKVAKEKRCLANRGMMIKMMVEFAMEAKYK
jgi:hypothetical protein